MASSIINDDMRDPEFRRLLAQEELILEVTEVLCGLLEEEKISRKELAERLGKTKGFVSQLLNGGRNLTLRTVADILHVLGYRVALKPDKLVTHRRANNVIAFPHSQTTYQMPKGPKYIHDEELRYYPKADNCRNIKEAISG
jgi:transcriptional regulator with XRE-family HTH domain